MEFMKDVQIQTEEIKVSEVSTQQPCYASLPTQTSTNVNNMLDESSSSLTGTTGQSAQQSITIDYHQLNRFLGRCVTLIQQEICDSCQFDQLSSSWLNYWDGASGKGIHCEKRLPSKILDDLLNDTKSSSADAQIISGITWNAPQTTLAVSYKVKIHSGWCTHKTFVLFWNLYFTNKSGDSTQSVKPLYSCEVDKCVTSLVAHPFKGSLYALGCYNGSLLIVDTRLLLVDTSSDLTYDLPIYASSPSRGDLHQDSIVGIHWLRAENKRDRWNESGEEASLISFSIDGLIVRWKLNGTIQSKQLSSSLQPIDLYNIELLDLPKAMGLKETFGKFFKGVPIASFTWEPETDSGFIVGCEAGGLFRCSLEGGLRGDSSDDPIRPTDWLPLKNPIVMAYVPHRAVVMNVTFSPNLRNIFISSGKDNELRVWDVFQSKPLYVVHCDVNITAIVWLFARSVIFTVQEDGFICIYSINHNTKPKLIHRFSLEERKPAHLIWSNYLARDDQLAISDDDNTIHLYSVHLTSDNIIPDNNI